MCDVLIYSHEERLLKPDPRIYLLACARLGLAPDNVVFADDTPGAVDAARRLGMKGVNFVSNGQTIEEVTASLAPPPR
jgi:putative hydrolase of the HAD superfamily